MSTVRNLLAKPAPPTETKRPAREKAGAATWSRWVRVLVSLLIAWHLMAVFLGPFSVPPTSATIGGLASSKYVRWYSEPLYIHHGYHFFAPNPGPGHIARYRVTGANGETLAEGQFPDRREHWPRLWYHRHFMLTDQVVMPLPPEIAEDRIRYVLEGYALHLLAAHQGERARVELLRHDLIGLDQFQSGRRLDDPSTYVSRMVVEQTSADLKRAEERRVQANVSAPQSGALSNEASP